MAIEASASLLGLWGELRQHRRLLDDHDLPELKFLDPPRRGEDPEKILKAALGTWHAQEIAVLLRLVPNISAYLEELSYLSGVRAALRWAEDEDLVVIDEVSPEDVRILLGSAWSAEIAPGGQVADDTSKAESTDDVDPIVEWEDLRAACQETLDECLSVTDVAFRLGITAEEVKLDLKAGDYELPRLYGFATWDRKWRIPAWQFHSDWKKIPHLGQVIKAFGHAYPVDVQRLMTTPTSALRMHNVDHSPRSWLVAGGGVDAVLDYLWDLRRGR